MKKVNLKLEISIENISCIYFCDHLSFLLKPHSIGLVDFFFTGRNMAWPDLIIDHFKMWPKFRDFYKINFQQTSQSADHQFV